MTSTNSQLEISAYEAHIDFHELKLNEEWSISRAQLRFFEVQFSENPSLSPSRQSKVGDKREIERRDQRSWVFLFSARDAKVGRVTKNFVYARVTNFSCYVGVMSSVACEMRVSRVYTSHAARARRRDIRSCPKCNIIKRAGWYNVETT